MDLRLCDNLFVRRRQNLHYPRYDKENSTCEPTLMFQVLSVVFDLGNLRNTPTCFKTCPLLRPASVCSSLLQFCHNLSRGFLFQDKESRAHKIFSPLVQSQSLERVLYMTPKFSRVIKTEKRVLGVFDD